VNRSNNWTTSDAVGCKPLERYVPGLLPTNRLRSA
jgi:hypothetical protein